MTKRIADKESLAVVEDEDLDNQVERTLMFDQVAEQVYQWTYAEMGRPYFATFFLEGEQLYGLFNQQGKLFRATVMVDDDGESLVIGEMESVIHQFTPVNRSSFKIVRQTDGQLRFFTIAATSIINRVGEIDSTALFDDMIKRAEDMNYYPTLDFYHLGDADDRFEFGQFDYLARDGVVYIGSGLLVEDHPLSIAMERVIAKQPDQWGASIEYYRPENRGIEYIAVGSGIEIAVYTEGLNTRISLLPESDAANWFTTVQMEQRAMNARQKKALKMLFEGDEEGHDIFLDEIDGVNKEVRQKKLIHRSAKSAIDTTTTPAPKTPTVTPDMPPAAPPQAPSPTPMTPTPNPAPTPDTDEEVVLDEETMEKIARAVAINMETDLLTTMTSNLEKVTATLAKLMEGQSNLLASFNGMDERLGAIEVEEEEKQRTWLTDLPIKKSVKVTHRPSQQQIVADTTPPTFAVQAGKVLDSLPKVGAK